MKLVVCIDGTWNEASTRTNVWKLKQDIDCSAGADTQAAYVEGIGTVKGDELASGMFAADFDRPLGLAYRWLTKKMLNAPDGEDISVYLFGFSRGGYLAHTLSWLLSEVGIPRRFSSAVQIAKAYADKDAGAIERLKKDGIVASPLALPPNGISRRGGYRARIIWHGSSGSLPGPPAPFPYCPYLMPYVAHNSPRCTRHFLSS